MIICGSWQSRRAAPARTPDPPWRTRKETQNVRNVGQMETWGKSDAVNKRRGDFCRDQVWLPKGNAETKLRMEKLGESTFSRMLTREGVSEVRLGQCSEAFEQCC
jgi:hypothetical protein